MPILQRVEGLGVPQDLLSETECNGDNVWKIPEHNGSNGKRCRGSGNLVYESGTTRRGWQQEATCHLCQQTFSSS